MKKSKSLFKNIFSIIICLILITGISFIVYALVSNYKSQQQDYLSFSVVTDNGKVLRSSEDNLFITGKTYTFTTKYLYSEDVKAEEQNTNFKARIYSDSKYGFDYYLNDDKPYGFNGVNYSEKFNLKIDDNKFSITIPDLQDIFFGAKDENDNDIYLGNIFSFDSFILIVESFNLKTIIEYKFHFATENAAAIYSIEIDDDLTFVSDKSDTDFDMESVEVEDNVEFENTGIPPAFDIDNIEIENNVEFKDNTNIVSNFPIDNIEIEGNVEFKDKKI